MQVTRSSSLLFLSPCVKRVCTSRPQHPIPTARNSSKPHSLSLAQDSAKTCTFGRPTLTLGDGKGTSMPTLTLGDGKGTSMPTLTLGDGKGTSIAPDCFWFFSYDLSHFNNVLYIPFFLFFFCWTRSPSEGEELAAKLSGRNCQCECSGSV
jgi:hypothetical protein